MFARRHISFFASIAFNRLVFRYRPLLDRDRTQFESYRWTDDSFRDVVGCEFTAQATLFITPRCGGDIGDKTDVFRLFRTLCSSHWFSNDRCLFLRYVVCIASPPLQRLRSLDLLPRVHSVKAALYGSLSATGRGHMTPQALLLGLEGSLPDSVE